MSFVFFGMRRFFRCGGGFIRVVVLVVMNILYIIFNIYNIDIYRFNKEKKDRDCEGRFDSDGKCGNR